MLRGGLIIARLPQSITDSSPSSTHAPVRFLHFSRPTGAAWSRRLIPAHHGVEESRQAVADRDECKWKRWPISNLEQRYKENRTESEAARAGACV